jgi:nitroreductase
VVKDLEKREALAEAAGQEFVAQAPVIIAAVALDLEHILSSGNPAYAIDLAIAVDHMTLAAAAEGLGTCWIGAFSQKKAKDALNVPDDCQVVALLPLGFPADLPKPKIRKPLKEIVSYESFE